VRVREFWPLRGRAARVLGWLVGLHRRQDRHPGHVDSVPSTSAALFAGHDWEWQACARA
jgi:hypothetical protein